MNQVLAAGVILYRGSLTSGGIEYLLLQKPNEKWAPAKGSQNNELLLKFTNSLITCASLKGRLENDETDLEAALRETWEETGLVDQTDYEILNKQFTITNLYQTRNNKSKRVVYFVARVKDSNVAIKLSHEHVAFKWLSFETILALYTNSEMTRAIVEANEYLMTQN